MLYCFTTFLKLPTSSNPINQIHTTDILKLLEIEIKAKLQKIEKSKISITTSKLSKDQLNNCIKALKLQIAQNEKFITNANKKKIHQELQTQSPKKNNSGQKSSGRRSANRYLPKKSDILKCFENNLFFIEFKIFLDLPLNNKKSDIFKTRKSSKIENFVENEIFQNLEFFEKNKPDLYWLVISINGWGEMPVAKEWEMSFLKNLLKFL